MQVPQSCEKNALKRSLCLLAVLLVTPETHSKIQATQHGCLPSLLADEDKRIEKVQVRKKYFVLGRPVQPRQNKNVLYWPDKPNEPIKEGPLSFALFESPITSVSTVSRGQPSLVSLSNIALYIMVNIQDIQKECSYIYHACLEISTPPPSHTGFQYEVCLFVNFNVLHLTRRGGGFNKVHPYLHSFIKGRVSV